LSVAVGEAVDEAVGDPVTTDLSGEHAAELTSSSVPHTSHFRISMERIQLLPRYCAVLVHETY
jgi:hypothetical protein